MPTQLDPREQRTNRAITVLWTLASTLAAMFLLERFTEKEQMVPLKSILDLIAIGLLIAAARLSPPFPFPRNRP